MVCLNLVVADDLCVSIYLMAALLLTQMFLHKIPYVAKGVDCLPDHFEEEISINGPYGASYDDDEWSNMASSDMGDDLLFEL